MDHPHPEFIVILFLDFLIDNSHLDLNVRLEAVIF